MAHLELDSSSGRYRVRFRFGGRQYKRSLKTSDYRLAQALVGRIDETIQLLERGRLDLPKDADPGLFILSDGKRLVKPSARRPVSLGELFEEYQATMPAGAKEASTIAGEKRHMAHVMRHLGSATSAQSITLTDMQTYVAKRLADRYKKRPTSPDTIKKELTTFRLIWNWAVAHAILEGTAPIRGLRLPRRDEKPPFMTRDEIAQVIRRHGLSAVEEKELWQGLYLTSSETQSLLDYVQQNARHSFIYPMFVFAAHTGIRRSELVRTRIDDFDFERGVVLIREKKKSRSRATTYRRVDLTERLRTAMQAWFARHPGGQFALCTDAIPGSRKLRHLPQPLTVYEAQHHFRVTLAASQWKVVRGFHTLRHSFASNLAGAGVDQRIIDEWMGHTTEEMRRRYRHLVPDVRRAAIALLLPGLPSMTTCVH